jgi:hypothetical protein
MPDLARPAGRGCCGYLRCVCAVQPVGTCLLSVPGVAIGCSGIATIEVPHGARLLQLVPHLRLWLLCHAAQRSRTVKIKTRPT